jgi:hypothetical protein
MREPRDPLLKVLTYRFIQTQMYEHESGAIAPKQVINPLVEGQRLMAVWQ